MKFNEYIKDKLIEIIIIAIFLSLSTFLLSYLGIEGQLLIFFLILYILPFVLILLYDYYNEKNFIYELKVLKKALKNSKYIDFKFNSTYSYSSELIVDLIEDFADLHNKKTDQVLNNKEEFREYIMTWLHEIKTPLATSKLIVKNNYSRDMATIDRELDSIDFLLGQVLYYVKINDINLEYIISRINLKDIVKEALNKNIESLLAYGFKPYIKDLDYQVLADKAWLFFILDQIINNSIKYRDPNKKPEIKFTCQDQGEKIILIIEDNGLGIGASDLPRVFEKGYQGRKDFSHGESTGIGLYLVKKLADKMSTTVEVESILSEYTRIKITLLKAI